MELHFFLSISIRKIFCCLWCICMRNTFSLSFVVSPIPPLSFSLCESIAYSVSVAWPEANKITQLNNMQYKVTYMADNRYSQRYTVELKMSSIGRVYDQMRKTQIALHKAMCVCSKVQRIFQLQHSNKTPRRVQITQCWLLHTPIDLNKRCWYCTQSSNKL